MRVGIVFALFVMILGCSPDTSQTAGKHGKSIAVSTTDILAKETIRDSRNADLFIFNDRVYVLDRQLTVNSKQLGHLFLNIKLRI